MILDTTSKVLRIVLGEAHTTNPCQCVASWAESAAPDIFSPGNTNILTNGTTPVIVVAAPTKSGRSRDAREVRVFNNDTVSHTVTLQLFDGTNTWIVAPAKVTVAANGSFIYTPGSGITVTGSSSSPTGAASGDLSGTYPSPSVAALAGQPLGSTTAGSGNLLIGSGSLWVSHAITGDWTITAGGASTVAKVNGVSYGTLPATNTFPLVTAANTVTYTATNQIPGTTTNDSASAGNIGEFVSSTVLAGAAVSLTTNIAANVTSVSLTGGDWDVFGSVFFTIGGTCVVTEGWASQTSATTPTAPNSGGYSITSMNTGTLASGQTQVVGSMRQSLSGTTSVFLGALAGFTTSTVAAYGFIGARRRR